MLLGEAWDTRSPDLLWSWQEDKTTKPFLSLSSQGAISELSRTAVLGLPGSGAVSSKALGSAKPFMSHGVNGRDPWPALPGCICGGSWYWWVPGKARKRTGLSEITNLPLSPGVLKRGGDDSVNDTGTWPDAACGGWGMALVQLIGAVLFFFLMGQSNFQSTCMKLFASLCLHSLVCSQRC